MNKKENIKNLVKRMLLSISIMSFFVSTGVESASAMNGSILGEVNKGRSDNKSRRNAVPVTAPSAPMATTLAAKQDNSGYRLVMPDSPTLDPKTGVGGNSLIIKDLNKDLDANYDKLLDMYRPIFLSFCRVIPSCKNWCEPFRYIYDNMLSLNREGVDSLELQYAYGAVHTICCSYDALSHQCDLLSDNEEFCKNVSLFFSLASKVFDRLVKNSNTQSFSDDVGDLPRRFSELSTEIKKNRSSLAIEKYRNLFCDAADAWMLLFPNEEY